MSDQPAHTQAFSLPLTLKKLACKAGLHAWNHHADYFIGCKNNNPVTLGWKECPRCYTSKLKWIFRG